MENGTYTSYNDRDHCLITMEPSGDSSDSSESSEDDSGAPELFNGAMWVALLSAVMAIWN